MQKAKEQDQVFAFSYSGDIFKCAIAFTIEGLLNLVI